AARPAERTTTFCIHVASRIEVVDAAHRVIRHVTRNVIADQHRSDIGFAMLTGRISNKRFPLIRIVVLQPFSLSDWIVCQGDHSISREVATPTPVLRLPSRSMSRREDDCRKWSAARRWY